MSMRAGRYVLPLLVLVTLTRTEPAVADTPVEQIRALVLAIDERPNPLHSDITPAVLRLIELGLPAAAQVVDLLDAPNPKTRQHAQRVIEGVVMRQSGWVPKSRLRQRRRGPAHEDRFARQRRLSPRRAAAGTGGRGARKWRDWVQKALADDEKRGPGR